MENKETSFEDKVRKEELAELERHRITADQMPKATEPIVMIVSAIICVLGCIVGIQVQIHTGTTPDTSIVGAIFAVLVAQIPLIWTRKMKSVHRQNLVQTATSGATFAAANCMLLTIGIPVIMGWPELMYPMLIGCSLATVVDATILYKCYGSPMFPAEGPWPPGIADAQSILAMADKGKKGALLLGGAIAGWIGAMFGIPMDLFGVAWVGSIAAMGAFGVGALIKGIYSSNMFAINIGDFSHTFVADIFGKGFVYTDHIAFTYIGHGAMIGAGVISLVQCAIMLFSKKNNDSSAATQFNTSLKDMRGALGKGFIAYIIIAIGLAFATGLYTKMGVTMFIIWIIFAAIAAIVSELIVGVSAMHSGWFPGFATALIFLIIGMVIGFPPLPLAILSGYTAATGPCFSDMGYMLKAGYILRGYGTDPELEHEGRKQQYFSILFGFVIAFIMVAIFAKSYFSQGMFAPIDAVYQSTIAAGSTPEVMKWLLIWAIPGAIIQLIGGEEQIGILFATGLLIGWTDAGITLIIAIIIRIIVVKKNPENDKILAILGAGSMVGCALHDFFYSVVGLTKAK
jgi:uncharacterized oligopeptide transporter (OPT) family protein